MHKQKGGWGSLLHVLLTGDDIANAPMNGLGKESNLFCLPPRLPLAWIPLSGIITASVEAQGGSPKSFLSRVLYLAFRASNTYSVYLSERHGRGPIRSGARHPKPAMSTAKRCSVSAQEK